MTVHKVPSILKFVSHWWWSNEIETRLNITKGFVTHRVIKEYYCDISSYLNWDPDTMCIRGCLKDQIHNGNYTITTSCSNVILQQAKVKQSRYTPWRRLGGEEYSSWSFTTSALDRGEWSASRPGRALPPGKGPPVPIEQEAGWAPEPGWTLRIEENAFAPAGDRTPIARSSSP
jgi:hypothetical protein